MHCNDTKKREEKDIDDSQRAFEPIRTVTICMRRGKGHVGQESEIRMYGSIMFDGFDLCMSVQEKGAAKPRITIKNHKKKVI
jgi:hypothetical protein